MDTELPANDRGLLGHSQLSSIAEARSLRPDVKRELSKFEIDDPIVLALGGA